MKGRQRVSSSCVKSLFMHILHCTALNLLFLLCFKCSLLSHKSALSFMDRRGKWLLGLLVVQSTSSFVLASYEVRLITGNCAKKVR